MLHMSVFRRRVFAIVAMVAALIVPASLRAQCADGSPPPCQRRVVARPPVPIDSNRVAVIPFRVTTADSLLGEGFAELLAGEFTGEGSPRSVDMATVISAWRHAGGGLRTPLTQDSARQLARFLGAGLVAEGSIIGIGSRVTITANIVTTKDGKPRGQPARVSGSADSVEVLLSQVATSLLGATAATTRTQDVSRLTRSPAALRAYFEGLALLRRGRWLDAAAALEQSVGADSGFALAIYERWLIGIAGSMALPPGFPPIASVHDRLGPRERVVVDGRLGTTGAPRTRMQIAADRLAAAERLGDSPDAWFLYGDYIFHDGLAVVPAESLLAISRRAFSRAVALDSQPVFLFHLFETALQQRDTAAIRQLVGTYESIPDEWPRRWLGAVFLRDPVLIDRARRAKVPEGQSIMAAGDLVFAGSLPVPVALLDEGLRRISEMVSPADRDRLKGGQRVVHRMRGQPDAADRLLPAGQAHPLAAVFGLLPFAAVSGDPNLDAEVLEKYPAAAQDTPAERTRRACIDTVVHLAKGSPDVVKAGPLPATPTRCDRLIQIWRTSLAGPLSDSLFAALDTLVHQSRFSNAIGYEAQLLAHQYEARHDFTSALAAIRLYPHDFAGTWAAPRAREEGRLATLAGDTTGAIRAYRYYLDLYAEAEPRFTPQRDSVRAQLAGLEKRKR